MAGTSPLRRRMIEDMTVRNLLPATQRSCVQAVSKFSRFFGRSPATPTLEDVRTCQVHLASKGVAWASLNQTVAALRFFHGVTLGMAEVPGRIAHAREPRRLPVVLSADEVVRFLESVPSLKAGAALTTACAAGLRVSDVTGLRVADIVPEARLRHDGSSCRRRVFDTTGHRAGGASSTRRQTALRRPRAGAGLSRPLPPSRRAERAQAHDAIANSRLVAITDDTVSFLWKDDRQEGRRKVMTLDAGEVMRRFLLHVLRPGLRSHPPLRLPRQWPSRSATCALSTAAGPTHRGSAGRARRPPLRPALSA